MFLDWIFKFYFFRILHIFLHLKEILLAWFESQLNFSTATFGKTYFKKIGQYTQINKIIYSFENILPVLKVRFWEN